MSTNSPNRSLLPREENIKARTLKLLATPSNYELEPDGKILIKSLGTYLKGRGNVGVTVLDSEGELVYKFNSIKECASFFNVRSVTTISQKLDNGKTFEFKGKKLVFKRNLCKIAWGKLMVSFFRHSLLQGSC